MSKRPEDRWADMLPGAERLGQMRAAAAERRERLRRNRRARRLAKLTDGLAAPGWIALRPTAKNPYRHIFVGAGR